MAMCFDLARQALTLDCLIAKLHGNSHPPARLLLNATGPKNARRLWPISASHGRQTPHKAFSTNKTTFACFSRTWPFSLE